MLTYFLKMKQFFQVEANINLKLKLPRSSPENRF